MHFMLGRHIQCPCEYDVIFPSLVEKKRTCTFTNLMGNDFAIIIM
jgi:hypothetical protein